MRRKTESVNCLKEDDKYELQGWNNETDDLATCSNFLKILEKKITFPLLSKASQSKHRIISKIQNLPTVEEDNNKLQQIIRSIPKKSLNLSPLMKAEKIQKKELPIPEQNEVRKRKKHKTQVSRLPVSSEPDKIVKCSNILKTKQKNKSLKNFNRSFVQFFDSNKAVLKNEKNQTFSKMLNVKKRNHEKVPSVSTLPLKVKIAQFDPTRKTERQKQKQESKKLIKWDKFSISHDRLMKLYKNKQPIRHPTENANQLKKEVKRPIEKPVAEKHSSSVWLQRLVERKQLPNRVLKTESRNFFLDDHLQNAGQTKNINNFHE